MLNSRHLSSASTSVVLWEGEYKNDGLERMKWINSAANRVTDAVVEGEPGNWRLVVAAPMYDVED